MEEARRRDNDNTRMSEDRWRLRKQLEKRPKTGLCYLYNCDLLEHMQEAYAIFFLFMKTVLLALVFFGWYVEKN